MRYIDLTLPQDEEPTYNNFQTLSGIIAIAGIIATVIFAIASI